MKKSVLKVQMFGAYSIEYEGKPISLSGIPRQRQTS